MFCKTKFTNQKLEKKHKRKHEDVYVRLPTVTMADQPTGNHHW